MRTTLPRRLSVADSLRGVAFAQARMTFIRPNNLRTSHHPFTDAGLMWHLETGLSIPEAPLQEQVGPYSTSCNTTAQYAGCMQACELVALSISGGGRPRPSLAGYWVCCVCRQANNPAFVPNVCTCGRHVRASCCYVYSGQR